MEEKKTVGIGKVELPEIGPVPGGFISRSKPFMKDGKSMVKTCSAINKTRQLKKKIETTLHINGKQRKRLEKKNRRIRREAKSAGVTNG